MAYKYPYTLGSSALIQVIEQLRRAFPATITAETLKKLGIAPNSESYLINTLKFIGAIDSEGNKSKEATTVFAKHDNDEFAQAFSGLIRNSYSELFSLHGDESWTLATAKLISFFRASDESSADVGKRQTSTFQVFAKLSGYTQVLNPKTQKPKTNAKKDVVKENSKSQDKKTSHPPTNQPNKGTGPVEKKGRDLGLTVRIEINLPAIADQETYNRPLAKES